LAYLRSIRVYIGISVLIFLTTAVMGYLAAGSDPEFAASWMKELEALRWIMGLSPLMIMVVIFLKNLMACAMSVLLGLGLGIVPLLVVTSNGMLLGIVSYGAVKKAGVLYLMAGILPHGVIELPVVLTCIAMGFRLGHVLILSILGEDEDVSGETRKAVLFLVKWVAPLLLLAAAIETFITPIAISMVPVVPMVPVV
jgi:stage II sporulation protein M